MMAWLALVWKIAGYSIEATRVAMLLIATATALAVFLLAIQLCRRLPGAPSVSCNTTALSGVRRDTGKGRGRVGDCPIR